MPIWLAEIVTNVAWHLHHSIRGLARLSDLGPDHHTTSSEGMDKEIHECNAKSAVSKHVSQGKAGIRQAFVIRLKTRR